MFLAELHIPADLAWEIATLSYYGNGWLLCFTFKDKTKGSIMQKLLEILNEKLLGYSRHVRKSVDYFSQICQEMALLSVPTFTHVYL